jgi:hypothetical protein
LTATRLTNRISSACSRHSTTSCFISLSPHSTHLPQPLGRSFFRRLKSQYRQFPPASHDSNLSSTCVRLFMPAQASYVTHTIWNAFWDCPVIKNGSCITFTFDQDQILREPALNRDQAAISEKARGPRLQDSEWGALNPAQAAVLKSSCCERPLRPDGDRDEQEDGHGQIDKIHHVAARAETSRCPLCTVRGHRRS